MKLGTVPASSPAATPRRYALTAFGVTEGPMTGEAGCNGAVVAGADI